MRLITGTGIAAGALLIAGGTSAAAPHGSAEIPGWSLANAAVAEHHLSDVDADDAMDHADGVADDVEGTEPDETGEEDGDGSALGRAHAAAMRIWAQCVADAASGPKLEGQPMPPKLACGEKPLGPGQIEHLAPTTAESGTESPDADEPSDEIDDDSGDGGEGRGHQGWGHHGTSHGSGHHGGGHRG